MGEDIFVVWIIFILGIVGFAIHKSNNRKHSFHKLERSQLLYLSTKFLTSEITRLEKILNETESDEEISQEIESELKAYKYQLEQIGKENLERIINQSFR